MIYSIDFSRKAFKELEQIGEPYYTKIIHGISGLATTPRPHGCKKLKGTKGYRIRIGNYRVIYDIFDNKLLIDVITIAHRKDVYE